MSPRISQDPITKKLFISSETIPTVKWSGDWTGWDLRFILSKAYTGDITYRVKKNKLLDEITDPWVEYTVTLTNETIIECNLNWLLYEFFSVDDEAVLLVHQYEIWLPADRYSTSINQDIVTNKIFVSGCNELCAITTTIYEYLTYRLIIKNQAHWNSYTSRQHIVTQLEDREYIATPTLPPDEGEGVIVPSYLQTVQSKSGLIDSTAIYARSETSSYEGKQVWHPDGYWYLPGSVATALFNVEADTLKPTGEFEIQGMILFTAGVSQYINHTRPVGKVITISVDIGLNRFILTARLYIPETHSLLSYISHESGGGISNTIISPVKDVIVSGDFINATYPTRQLQLVPEGGWLKNDADDIETTIIDESLTINAPGGGIYRQDFYMNGWPYSHTSLGAVFTDLRGYQIVLDDILSAHGNYLSITSIANESSYWERQQTLAAKYLNQTPATIAEVVEGGFVVTDGWDAGKYKMRVEGLVADRATAKAIKLRYDFKEPKP